MEPSQEWRKRGSVNAAVGARGSGLGYTPFLAPYPGGHWQVIAKGLFVSPVSHLPDHPSGLIPASLSQSGEGNMVSLACSN